MEWARVGVPVGPSVIGPHLFDMISTSRIPRPRFLISVGPSYSRNNNYIIFGQFF